MALALSRTCDLADFPGTLTVAAWQQRLAAEAWRVWVEESHIRTRAESLCLNWSGALFTAPGPGAIYRYRGQSDNGVERAVPAVWGLSVLERHEAPVKFLTQAHELLRPHGLLFLTFVYWDAEGEDCASGHEDRARIYDKRNVEKLMVDVRRVGFVPFGGVDWAYHGDKLEDHSLASLVLVKR